MVTNWKQLLIPYDQAVEELKVKFKSIRNEYRKLGQYSPIEFVTGRVKKISSIIDKAQKRGVSLDEVEEQIEDIAGIRIMCQFEEDIQKVVELIRSRDGRDLEIVEERDYITNMKESGYRSYHIIIKYYVQTAFGEKEILAEIQIRTLAMNFWATIEHSLNYKFKKNIPQEVKQRLRTAADAAFKLDEEMSEIRDEIMDAQELFQAKSNLVADVIGKLQNIQLSGKIENVDELQQEFLKIQEEGSILVLKDFDRNLRELIEKNDIKRYI